MGEEQQGFNGVLLVVAGPLLFSLFWTTGKACSCLNKILLLYMIAGSIGTLVHAVRVHTSWSQGPGILPPTLSNCVGPWFTSGPLLFSVFRAYGMLVIVRWGICYSREYNRCVLDLMKPSPNAGKGIK